MAQYGRHHHVLISDVADLESDRLRRDMFDGNEDATRIRSFSLSGQIDPYTEEITYFESHTWINASGIVTTIKEEDHLLGDAGGRMRAGDTMVLYHYDSISGVYLTQNIDEIELCVPGASGLYQVAARRIETVGGRPMFLKIGLIFDSNAS